MALSKEDTLHAKGLAILAMVSLHLFCRLGDLPYTPLIWIGSIPLIYYIGLLGDCCTYIYCFCSGYTHYLTWNRDKSGHIRNIPNKILRFISNYWVVLILFSIIGLVFDHSGTIPGSFNKFLGNFFIVNMNYNGAWWFISTYLFLLVFSPLLAYCVKKVPSCILILISGCVYFIAYIFRFNYSIDIQNGFINWIWNQLLLFGTSQFSYLLGMVLYKLSIIERIRAFFADGKHFLLRAMVIFIIPATCLLGHCIVQSLVVAPITAMVILISLFLLNLPGKIGRILAFLGKYSTNIWFTHMFFYLTLFNGLVFKAQYPLLILIVMFAICIPVSMMIDIVYQPVRRKIDELTFKKV